MDCTHLPSAVTEAACETPVHCLLNNGSSLVVASEAACLALFSCDYDLRLGRTLSETECAAQGACGPLNALVPAGGICRDTTQPPWSIATTCNTHTSHATLIGCLITSTLGEVPNASVCTALGEVRSPPPPPPPLNSQRSHRLGL